MPLNHLKLNNKFNLSYKSNLNKKLILKLLAEKNIILVAVTKNIPIETIKELINLGVKNIGENKVQEFEEKCQKCPLLKEILERNHCKTHFIGHLQSNKAKKAVELFDVIQSIDSERIAKKVDDEAKKIKKVGGAGKIGKVIDVMIQVNIGKEHQKHGILPEHVVEFYNTIKPLLNINIIGLMCIAPDVPTEQTRQYFQIMAAINKKLNLKYLSMGMSNDYHVAIEEGSNMIRLGRSLFS